MDKKAVQDRLIRFEGSIPYMYKCTGGEVTVGIGHAIHSAQEAMALWPPPDPAAEDFARVAAAPVGNYAASYYEELSSCWLDEEEITALCQSDIDLYERELAEALPNWNLYPEPAQEALFDMGYNLGVAGLMKFPKMLAAVDELDWETAAKESHRNGIPEDRNQEIADLFLECKGEE